ncbi:MAG: helix-turn-helix domain-containing protein [Thermodesulfobacteriota bacterium]|nr:helix-turn-helix domain-containing protein [Thermodesulfobacteriota bacterium]
MGHVMTAEDLLDELKSMPFLERGRFFSILGRHFFQDDNLTHEQVFGHLSDAEFSSQEAAEYLEISIATFRRYVQKGKLKPSRVIGRSQIFATQSLKEFKRALCDVR